MRMGERPEVNPTRTLRVLRRDEALDAKDRVKSLKPKQLIDVGTYMMGLYTGDRHKGPWKRMLPAEMPFKDVDVGVSMSDVIGCHRNDWSDEVVSKLNFFAERARAMREADPDRFYAVPPEVLTDEFSFCNVHGKYDVDVAFELWRLVNDFPQQFLARSGTRSHGYDSGEMLRDHAYGLTEFVKDRFGRGLDSKSMWFLRLPIEAFSDIKGLKGVEDGFSNNDRDEPKGLEPFYDELFDIEGMEPTMSPGYLSALIKGISADLKDAGLDEKNSKNFLYALRYVIEKDKAFGHTLRSADLSKYPDYGIDYRGYSSVDFRLRLFVDAGTDELDDYFAVIPELEEWNKASIIAFIMDLGIQLDITALQKPGLCVDGLGRLPEKAVFEMVVSSGIDIAEIPPTTSIFRRTIDASELQHRLIQAAVAKNVANLRAGI